MRARTWAGIAAGIGLLLAASGCSVPEQKFDFVFSHESAYDRTFPIMPTALIVDGTRQEQRFLNLTARFSLVRAEDGSYGGTGELTADILEWRTIEHKTSKGGQAGPNARCESRTILTVQEMTPGTITVENVRVAEDGLVSGQMVLADVFENWEQTMDARGECSPVNAFYEWHRFVDLFNEAHEGTLEQTGGDDESFGSVRSTVDLGSFRDKLELIGGQVAHNELDWNEGDPVANTFDVDDISVVATAG